MTSRTLRLVLIVYLAKSALFGLAWFAVPDLPQRAAAKVRQTWLRVSQTARP